MAAVRSLAAVLAAALLAAGCGLPPRRAPPAPEPPPAAYGADATTDGAEAAATGWRDYVDDPPLQALIARALANNRDLRLAAARVDEARALAGLQHAERFPTVALQAGGERARTPADLSVTRAPLHADVFQAGVGVASWELDLWGRVRRLDDAARENLLASDAARRAVALSLVVQVADAALALRELDTRLAIARRTVASRDETLRITTRRVELGAASRLNLTQVQTLATQAQALAAQLAQAQATQAHALERLVGAPVAPGEAGGPLDDDARGFGPLRAGLPAALLLQRPDIVAAEHQLQAAQAGIDAARAAFLPHITLTASAGSASAAFEGLFDAGSGAWRIAPSLALPLLDGGRRHAQLGAAEARRAQALARYEQVVQAAFQDVQDAFSARRGLAEQLQVQRAAVAVQRERARLSRLRFEHGAAPFLDVLDAGRELLAAEQQLVQLRRALLSSQVRLYAALGGGAQTADAASTAEAPAPR